MFSFLLTMGDAAARLTGCATQMLGYFSQGMLNTACVGYNGSGITGRAVAEEPFDYGCFNRWPGEFPVFK